MAPTASVSVIGPAGAGVRRPLSTPPTPDPDGLCSTVAVASGRGPPCPPPPVLRPPSSPARRSAAAPAPRGPRERRRPRPVETGCFLLLVSCLLPLPLLLLLLAFFLSSFGTIPRQRLIGSAGVRSQKEDNLLRAKPTACEHCQSNSASPIVRRDTYLWYCV